MAGRFGQVQGGLDDSWSPLESVGVWPANTDRGVREIWHFMDSTGKRRYMAGLPRACPFGGLGMARILLESVGAWLGIW